MRAWPVVALLILASAARAQQADAPPEPPDEAPPPQTQTQQPAPSPSPSPSPPSLQPTASPSSPSHRYLTKVRAHVPSPEWTQDRSFTSTRFWLLDPGSYEVETWLRTRIPHEIVNGRGPNEYLWQHEVEMGVYPHLQIDLYENLINSDGKSDLQEEGVQIEARIAIPDHYGQMPLNPVVYLEFHPRHNAPDRAELRLLLGGSATGWLFLAANPYFEMNLEPTGPRFVMDAEVGTTLAAGFRVSDALRLSLELKIGGDMLGDVRNQLHFVWLAGPGFIVKPLPRAYRKYFKIMGTCLFALPGTDVNAQAFEPLVILASQW